MKTTKFLVLLAVSIAIVFIACKKDNENISDSEFGDDEANIFLRSVDYESNVIKPLIKPNDYSFYTEGTIEYKLDGEVMAKVDFGNGEKDQWAKKTVDGKTYDFDLTKKKKDCKYEKKIVRPLVKTDDCKYIVEGTIEYYEKGKCVATIDFGDGTCDEWATKTWYDGSKKFSLRRKGKDDEKGKK